MPIPSHHRRVLIFVLLSLIVAVVLIATYRDAIYNELDRLKLVPQPERFTELYFDNYAALPKKTLANQPILFAFTVHNLEGITTTYPYSVYFIDANGIRTSIDKNSVTIPDNATTSVTVGYTFKTSNLTGQVVVNLLNLNQQIDFILPNTNP